MKKGRLLPLLLLLCLPLGLSAQGVKTVGGTFEYVANPDLSLNAAKQQAIENAKLQAIAQEFGTLVSQDTEQRDITADGQEHSYFMQLNSLEVKGEWLEDLEEPTCEVLDPKGGYFVLRATVKGKARPISNEAVEFEASVLRNGTEARFADVNFRDKDDLFVRFKSPVSGYVAIYLIDEEPTAFCLLPYMGDTDGQQPVEQGKEYVFFSPSNAPAKERAIVDEMVMTCNSEHMEHNQIYVIFSPQPFTKALDEQVNDGLPRQLNYKDFNKWLSKCRRRDNKMGVKIMKLAIAKQ